MHHSEQKYAHSVLNGAFWDMEQVHYGICEIRLLGMLWMEAIIGVPVMTARWYALMEIPVLPFETSF